MFRRTFWFTAGAATGIWATTRVHRALRALEPDALAARALDRAALAGRRARTFAGDVREGMARRERELGEALGLTDDPDGGDARRVRALGAGLPPGALPGPSFPGRTVPGRALPTPGPLRNQTNHPTGKEDH
ncbi:DUF6167 family protein [Streptomyces sp. ST2-7A]|uniref:DUF6167 family protein n=1 Tax=Streptomyces sp. ST2-7A TaxID=2907214 RepID=UPI001F44D91B|nr:DUF6167 family protein [Streptomyces sp. ST2-7A]MCE7079710.1 DUF6167 family protein [Streptomyces sp. ST2-7A]